MPDQILIAFVAQSILYCFWPAEAHFTELLRILENEGATGAVRNAAHNRGPAWAGPRSIPS
ncbi:MAG: hypothetical protein K2R98_23000 [Gemmataceae bacterium]|nr:hypothetical protein [Gemmataceae bacterium]